MPHLVSLAEAVVTAPVGVVSRMLQGQCSGRYASCLRSLEPSFSKKGACLGANRRLTSSVAAAAGMHSGPPSQREYDAAVLGLGAFGSAAAYHLASRGARVLGIERQPHVGHSMGSSHGHTRIIRLAYAEGPEYVPLLKRSYRLFAQLEAESGQTLFYKTGMLDIGPGPVFQGSLRSAQLHQLDHEVLTGGQVNSRFPGYHIPEDWQAVYQPDGGILTPERIIQAHCQLAAAKGAELCTGQQVVGWKPLRGGGIQLTLQPGSSSDAGSDAAANSSSSSSNSSSNVSRSAAGHAHAHTATGPQAAPLAQQNTSAGRGGSNSVGAGPSTTTIRAGKVIVAAGSWVADLLPELRSLCVPVRQVVGWFQVNQQHNQHQRGHAQRLEGGREHGSSPRLFDQSSFPVFIIDDGQGGQWYGFPEHGPQPGFKIGRYNHLRQTVHPDHVSRELTEADDEALRSAVRKYFPAANGPLLAHSTCLFTNTPDSHFIIDHHPHHHDLIICSACSGHGFKMSSGVGQLLSHLALGGISDQEQAALHQELALHRISTDRPGHGEFLAAAAQLSEQRCE